MKKYQQFLCIAVVALFAGCSEEYNASEACKTGATKCVQNTLYKCAGGSFDAGTPCGDNETCGEDKDNPGQFKCNENEGPGDLCTENKISCSNSNALVTCVEGQPKKTEPCGEKTCGEDPAHQGVFVCLCSEDKTSCTEKNELVTCKAGSVETTVGCEDDTVCGEDIGTPAYGCLKQENAECAPDSIQCKGGLLKKCTSDGKFYRIKQCSKSEACSVTEGKCVPYGFAQCTPKSYFCSEKDLYECSDAKQWQHKGTCTDKCTAALGRCGSTANECVLGTFRCENNTSYSCKEKTDSGTKQTYNVWEKEISCLMTQTCNPSNGRCGGAFSTKPLECVTGQFRCIEGQRLYKCVGGVWKANGEACNRSEICDPGLGMCVPRNDGKATNCTPNAWVCKLDGTYGSACDKDATTWTDTQCLGGLKCDPVAKACKRNIGI